MSHYAARRDRLRSKFSELEVDAFLITNFVNVTYLTGFTGDDSYLLVTADKEIVLSDSRYAEQLENECPELTCEIRQTPTTMRESLQQVAGRVGATRVAVEANSMTVQLYEELREALPLTLCPSQGTVEALREIKDDWELGEIRKSIALAEQVFEELRSGLRSDQTERQLAAEMEYRIRCHGGRGCAFPPILAVGPHAALPHASPGDRRVGDAGLLLVDWGAVAGSYLSDLTRVLVTDKITPELERIYGVVLTAQQRAIEAIRPGVAMQEVDAQARQYIVDQGYGDRFGHGLGHGFGLEIHEYPRLSPKQTQLLQPGMVVTVEPGIYVPGWGGVRIEDDVLVTPDGHEVLSHVSKKLEDCVVSVS